MAEEFGDPAHLSEDELRVLARWAEPREETLGQSAAGYPVVEGDHVMPAGTPYRDAVSQGGYVEAHGVHDGVACVMFRTSPGPGPMVIAAVTGVVHTGLAPLRPHPDAITFPYGGRSNPLLPGRLIAGAEAARTELAAAYGHLQAGRAGQAAAALEEALRQPLSPYAAGFVEHALARLAGPSWAAGRPPLEYPAADPPVSEPLTGTRLQMLALVGRAASRAAADQRDQGMFAGYRPETWGYPAMRWRAVNAAALAGVSGEQADETCRLGLERDAHAARILHSHEEVIDEHARGMEALRRWHLGLPARDDYERDCYREYAQLEADVIDDYVTYVKTPDALWEAYSGPLSYEEFRAQYLAGLHDGGTGPPADAGGAGDVRKAVQSAFPGPSGMPDPVTARPDVQRARRERDRLRDAGRQARAGEAPF